MATPKLDAAKDAFDKAVELCNKAHPSGGAKLAKLKGTYKIEDVLDTVEAAKEAYGQRTKNSKARKWLSYFSSQVVYYGQILDTLSQHHPEWVSLGWGTMKFAFILVLNHEEMITELSKAMSEIADVLPRVEIQLEIFDAEKSLRAAVESLYAEIINFLLRTLKWYEQSRWKHALNAFTAPYKLRFEDFRDRVNRHARRVDKIANTLAQAKLVQMYRQIQELSAALKESDNVAKSSAEALRRIEFGMVEMDTKQIQVAMMLSTTKNTPLGSHLESLRYCQAVRRQRQSRLRLDYSHLTPALKAWAEGPGSSFIIVEGSAPKKLQTKNLATELVDLLKEAQKPTVWAFKGRAAINPSEEDSVHALKHLCGQTFQMNNEEATRHVSNNFNAARIESAVTESDWLQILQESLTGLPELFIVVDLELLSPASSDISRSLLFLRILEALLNNTKRVPIKLAVFTFRRPLLTALRSDTTEATIIPLEQRTAVASRHQKGGKKNSLPILSKDSKRRSPHR
ncbi:uncharacterized protein K452DRAFT_336461 [Aplosporella prunicola CBS 121167]|uniref:DUF7708 domain-containing protein n=1 Tax=Aplosporella prunicola CBS 121167 TaxID=1176127 RepID=A0A6A6B8X9_9PEZI|nr:uncharacterized protein K452DRAFT_336461 [Aplosporella prunicola CBS 121167]KAF2139755.1 hypothetical protein K452DRAFT_336461 [Aplosporella prunicola CBS 121167]